MEENTSAFFKKLKCYHSDKPPALPGTAGGPIELDSSGMLGCGPGARTFWAKSIGRAGPFLAVIGRVPQNGAGNRATGRSPLPGENPFHGGFGRLARPVHEMEAASWFLPRRSLPPGLAPNRRPPFGGVLFNPRWAVPCFSCLRPSRRYLTPAGSRRCHPPGSF